MMQVRLQEEWIQVEAGTTIDACLREQGREMDFFATVCDGELLDLRTPLQEGQKVMLIPAGSDIARLMQEKTLCFVIIVALRQLYPQLQVRIEHSLDNGIYCEFDHGTLDAPAQKCHAIRVSRNNKPFMIEVDVPAFGGVLLEVKK